MTTRDDGVPVRPGADAGGSDPRAVRAWPHARGYLRKLQATERPLLVEHLLRLDEYARTMRFMGYVSDGHIRTYGQSADHRQRLVLGYFVEGVLRGAGELVILGVAAWRGGCELALSVERPWQNRGVGTTLLTRLILLARNRGASPVQLHFLRENRRIATLARRLGMAVHFTGAEGEARLQPSWPNQFSLIAEGLGDGHAAWRAWTAPLAGGAGPAAAARLRGGGPERV